MPPDSAKLLSAVHVERAIPPLLALILKETLENISQYYSNSMFEYWR